MRLTRMTSCSENKIFIRLMQQLRRIYVENETIFLSDNFLLQTFSSSYK